MYWTIVSSSVLVSFWPLGGASARKGIPLARLSIAQRLTFNAVAAARWLQKWPA
jgi:hypothetical protein